MAILRKESVQYIILWLVSVIIFFTAKTPFLSDDSYLPLFALDLMLVALSSIAIFRLVRSTQNSALGLVRYRKIILILFFGLLCLGLGRHFLYKEYRVYLAPGEAVRFDSGWAPTYLQYAIGGGSASTLPGYLRLVDEMASARLPVKPEDKKAETIRRETELTKTLMEVSSTFLTGDSIPLTKEQTLFQERNVLMLDAFLKRQESLRASPSFSEEAWRDSVRQFYSVAAGRFFLPNTTPDKAPLIRMERLDALVKPRMKSGKVIAEVGAFTVGIRVTGHVEKQLPQGETIEFRRLLVSPSHVRTVIRWPMSSPDKQILLFDNDSFFESRIDFAIAGTGPIGSGYMVTRLQKDGQLIPMDTPMQICRPKESELCAKLPDADYWSMAGLIFFNTPLRIPFFILAIFLLVMVALTTWFEYRRG